jgi:hypothetical protein
VSQCVFEQAEPGIYRCLYCRHGVRTDNPERIRPSLCKSPVVAERLERAGLSTRCIHRGEPTGERVKGCGCGVATWQTEYHACELHGQCVLLHLAKRPGVKSCEKCGDDPARQG